jgi:hypothetical protein
MWVLALALAVGILALLIILLAVPVELVFSIERDEGFRSNARVRWMFGLIGKDIGGRKDGKQKPKKRRGDVKSILAALTTGGFPQKLMSLARRAVRMLKIREFEANFRIGLGDPAETGMLFAVIAPTMFFIKSFPSLEVNVEPDFEQEGLQGYCRGAIRAVPIMFVAVLIPFLLSATTIRALKAMARGHGR